MDADAVLRAFHEQVRERPQDAANGYVVEREAGIVRLVRETGGWAGVTCSDLEGADLDGVIAAQVERFVSFEGPWEWKYYSYDLPAQLPERLLAAGFRAEPVEAVLVAEIAELDLEPRLPEGIELVEVSDRPGAFALVEMQDRVFGSSTSGMAESLAAGLAEAEPGVAAVMACADGQAVSGGRVEFNAGTDFAGLWGGATEPAWRSRGLFRAVVAHRARLAADRGFRYLQVDASDQSLPILLRLGFSELAKTTPFTFTGAV